MIELLPLPEAVERAIGRLMRATAATAKNEAFEQTLDNMYHACRYQDAHYPESIERSKRARVAVLSAHSNAISQAECRGMERAAKIVEADTGMTPHGNYSLGPSVSSRIATAIRAVISQPASPEPQTEAIAELVDGLERGAQVNLPDFLDWMADRLVNIYQENPNVDFVLSCRARAKHLRALITKYKP